MRRRTSDQRPETEPTVHARVCSSPADVVRVFIQDIMRERTATPPPITICLVRLLNLSRLRSARPHVEEQVEGIIRSQLRGTDRLSWCGPESFLIVVPADLFGARQLMARLRDCHVTLARAAGGALELLWGLACSDRSARRSAEDLVQEAQANLNRMASSR